MLTDRDGVPFPPIRRLGPADHRHCVALSVDRGWSPEEAKWLLLLEEAQTFGVDAPDGGGLAGAVVLARYAPGLASVGMMLVAGRYGRRGLGRALMTRLLAEAGSATVTLFATDAGKPLYTKLGFRTVRKSASFVGGFRQVTGSVPGGALTTGASRGGEGAAAGEGRGSGGAGPAGEGGGSGGAGSAGEGRGSSWIRGAGGAGSAGEGRGSSGIRGAGGAGGTRPAAAADMTAILRLDKAAFGADRGYLLRRLPSFAERLRVIGNGNGITGYAAAWRNGNVAVIGPIVAASGADARRLITDLAAEVRGPVRLDLDPDRPELPEWALNRGLQPVTRTSVMAHGGWPPPGDPSRLFAPISVALA